MTNGNAATGLRDLNAGIPGADQIKGAVSAVYDDVASWSRTGDFWNWGMHCPDLLKELTDICPNFNAGVSDGFSEQLYFQTLRGLPYSKNEFKNLKVLEVGCGMGEGLNFLTRLVDPARAVGLDISAAAIRRANALLARGDRLTYVEGDAEQLPFADGEFDLVYCCDVLEHVSDVDKSVGEAARVLKPGGWYLFDTINRTAKSKIIMIKLFQEWSAFRWAPRDLHDWDKFVTPEELERSLTGHGLRNEEFVGFVPGRHPLKVLSLLRQRARGGLSYGEMGRQMQITVSRTDISGGYGGHARKTR